MANRKMLIMFFSIMLISLVLFSTFLLRDDPASPAATSNDDRQEAGEDDVQADPNLKQLYITVDMSANEFERLQEASDTFSNAYPSIEVHLKNLALEEDESPYETFKRESQLGTSADVMLMDNHWVLEFAALGYLRYVDGFYGNAAAELLPAALEPLKWNGFVWGVPKDLNPYVLVINREKALEYGLSDAPTNAEQWISQVAAIRNAQEGLAEPMYFNPKDAESWLALDWPLLRQFLSSPEDKSSQPSLEERFPAPDEAFDPWVSLEEGELVYMVTTLSEAVERSREAEQPFEIAPLPQSAEPDAVPGLYRGGHSYVVSSRSELTSEALEWIRTVNTSEFQLVSAVESGRLPVWTAAYQAEELREAIHAQVLTAVEYVDQLPAVPGLSGRLEDFRNRIEAVWKGEAEIEELVPAIEQLRALE